MCSQPSEQIFSINSVLLKHYVCYIKLLTQANAARHFKEINKIISHFPPYYFTSQFPNHLIPLPYLSEFEKCCNPHNCKTGSRQAVKRLCAWDHQKSYSGEQNINIKCTSIKLRYWQLLFTPLFPDFTNLHYPSTSPSAAHITFILTPI